MEKVFKYHYKAEMLNKTRPDYTALKEECEIVFNHHQDDYAPGLWNIFMYLNPNKERDK